VTDALIVSGWVAAALATTAALSAWRILGERMEVVARACHELRGPVTAARLGLELGVRVGEISPARLRAIDLELGRAALALEDLADPRGRRVAAARVDRIDVKELLLASVEAWQATAAVQDIQLGLRWSGGSAFVRGDRTRLAQATGNLFANAIEHGGGPVDVRGHLERGFVRIEVIDSGPGLPAPVLELARRPRNGRGRRGRGLAIAAAIAADHGGRLAGAPTERGARLVLELPACDRARPSSTATG
jgi:signal transduction histidine kinase